MRMVTIVLHVTQTHFSNTICVGMEWPKSEGHRRISRHSRGEAFKPIIAYSVLQ